MKKISSTNRIIGFENRRIGGVSSPVRAAARRTGNVTMTIALGRNPLVNATPRIVIAIPTIVVVTPTIVSVYVNNRQRHPDNRRCHAENRRRDAENRHRRPDNRQRLC